LVNKKSKKSPCFNLGRLNKNHLFTLKIAMIHYFSCLRDLDFQLSSFFVSETRISSDFLWHVFVGAEGGSAAGAPAPRAGEREDPPPD
jgi:hypothetical protein